MKIISQAGLRKVYYFPSKHWELGSVSDENDQETKDKKEKNKRSVARLISNNPIALTLFIPQWDHGDVSEYEKDLLSQTENEGYWFLDETIGRFVVL